MTEYISEQNQHILWNAIQRIQLLHETIRSSEQSAWFKEIVGMFYMQNRHRTLNVAEVKELNKATIHHMIKTLSQMKSPILKVNQSEPKFKEDLTDGVIENMDELLQQQMKQRELDVMNPIAELRLEIHALSETVKTLSVELAKLKKSFSVPESQETA
jgi:hypothetical protein